MIHKIGDGPWMFRVQYGTYTRDEPISDEMAGTIQAEIAEGVKNALKVKEVEDGQS